jgi:hypothetical protein
MTLSLLAFVPALQQDTDDQAERFTTTAGKIYETNFEPIGDVTRVAG